MAKTVKIYTTPTCTWCAKAKEFFKEHKVKFEEINVSTDLKAREKMIEMTGQRGVPVIEIDDTIIVGYDEAALREALEL